MNLPKVFKLEKWLNDVKDEGYLVTLEPQLSDYRATLDYDGAGNANVTIVHKKSTITILDMSLDNGEINELDTEFFNN